MYTTCEWRQAEGWWEWRLCRSVVRHWYLTCIFHQWYYYRTLPMYCEINLPTVKMIGPESPKTGFTTAEFYIVYVHNHSSLSLAKLPWCPSEEMKILKFSFHTCTSRQFWHYLLNVDRVSEVLLVSKHQASSAIWGSVFVCWVSISLCGVHMQGEWTASIISNYQSYQLTLINISAVCLPISAIYHVTCVQVQIYVRNTT